MPWPKGKPRPPGAGRKLGTPNRNTLPVAELCAFHNCSPAEILIRFAMSTDPDDKNYKFQAARELANFIYPKMQSSAITATIDMELARKARDVEEMSLDDQIKLLESELKRLKSGSGAV